MSKEENNVLAENVGGYVVKVGRYFVASYKRSLLQMNALKYPDMLTDRLYKVKDILYSVDTAKEVAKELDGKVYQICVEPVEKSKNTKA